MGVTALLGSEEFKYGVTLGGVDVISMGIIRVTIDGLQAMTDKLPIKKLVINRNRYLRMIIAKYIARSSLERILPEYKTQG